MFITVHAAAAMVIGKHVESSWLAFVIGFILHFLFDMIPHGDDNLGKKFFGIELKKFRRHEDFRLLALYGTLDAAVLSVFLVVMMKNFAFVRNDNTIWAIIGSILPDFLVACYKLYDIKPLRWFYKLHSANHRLIINYIKKDFPTRYGMVWQLVIFSIMIYMLFVT